MVTIIWLGKVCFHFRRYDERSGIVGKSDIFLALYYLNLNYIGHPTKQSQGSKHGVLFSYERVNIEYVRIPNK